MVGSLHLPNGQQSLVACGWMEYYFNLVGDSPPCQGEEIHLEPVAKGSVYDEYVSDMRLYTELT